jgi:hypothetical protein
MGEIAGALGARMEQQVRQGLTEVHELLWLDATAVVAEVERFLIGKCGVRRAEVAGEYRRKLEVVRVRRGGYPSGRLSRETLSRL